MPGPPPPSLADLVAAIGRGDRTAIHTLHDSTCDQLYGVAVRIVRDEQIAEDVCLEVYAQAWRSAASYTPRRGSVLAWLVTMVRSRAIDRLRQDQARPAAGPDVLEAMADRGEGPATRAEAGDAAEHLREALGTLAPEQRQALESAFFGGLTHAEIARRTDLPLGTVKRRIRDGLERLREALERKRGARR